MNLFCVKIWSSRNVVWLLNYYRVWSDFEIDEVWERKLREKGETQKNREKVSWEKEEYECWGEGGVISFFFYGCYIISTLKKFCPRKLAYHERLGYDYLLFYFIPQVESHEILQYFDYVNVSSMKLLYLRTNKFNWLKRDLLFN